MKVPFSKKIAVKLLFPYFVLTLVLFTALSAGFYYFSQHNPFEDLPRRRLIDLLAGENATFRLIITVDKSEAMLLLTIVSLIVAAFAVFILFLLFSAIYRRKAGAKKGGENESADAMAFCPDFAGIADEMRTSLRVIDSVTDEVIKSYPHPHEHDMDVLNGIRHASKDLHLLADNLFNYYQFAQTGSGHAVEPFNLYELLNDIESYAKELAGTKEVEVIVDCEEALSERALQTDRSLLKRLLLNLVHISVKETPVGTVTILATGKMKNGVEYIEVTVADNGIGPGKGELKKSLGLCAGRNIAEILGGELKVESLYGRGSVFTAVIPVKAVD